MTNSTQFKKGEKVEIGNIEIWTLVSHNDDNEDVEYIIISDLGKAYICGVMPCDEYRDHGLIFHEISPLKTVFWDRELIGRYNNAEYYFEENEEDYGYTFFADGRNLGSAWFDYSDSYYPRGFCHFYNEKEEKEALAKVPEKLLYKKPELVKEIFDEYSFVVTGEPRLGKTTTINYHFDFKNTNAYGHRDTDAYGDPEFVLNMISTMQNMAIYTIGKYRNTKIIVNEQSYDYHEFITEMLKEKGFKVMNIHFLERKGTDMDTYMVFIENNTGLENKEVGRFFKNVSNEPKEDCICFKKPNPCFSKPYIHAVLTIA